MTSNGLIINLGLENESFEQIQVDCNAVYLSLGTLSSSLAAFSLKFTKSCCLALCTVKWLTLRMAEEDENSMYDRTHVAAN